MPRISFSLEEIGRAIGALEVVTADPHGAGKAIAVVAVREFVVGQVEVRGFADDREDGAKDWIPADAVWLWGAQRDRRDPVAMQIVSEGLYTPVDLEDAHQLVHGALRDLRVGLRPEDSYGPNHVARVHAAGVRLSAEVRRLEQEAERSAGRAQRPGAAAAVEGHELLHGVDGGGQRHYLGGRPVSAGTGLFLLTRIGWLPGRYESTRSGGELMGYFHFGLPGCGFASYAIPLRECARLAWPDEVEGHGVERPPVCR